MREGADRELVVAEDVGIVRVGEVGSEFADSASTASRIALTRSSTSACFSDDREVDGMMDSASRTRFSSTRPAIPLVYKNSTNFQDAYRDYFGFRVFS